MRSRYVLVAAGLVFVLVLGACSKAEPTPESAGFFEGEMGGPGGVLQGTTGLALGTLRLEGTEYAVTPEQAARLLPLWKAIQSGSLQGAAETEAVLKQIQGVMDEEQLAVIDEMALTFQDIGAWMESPSAKALGIEMPTPPAGRTGGPGGAGAFQNMTDEQRNQLRQELQNMTAEQRATRMAEMGFQRPEGDGQGGGFGRPSGAAPDDSGGRPRGFGARGGDSFLVGPLVELLTARASE